jgi:hypothetical protein
MDGVYPTVEYKMDYSVGGLEQFLKRLDILKPEDYTYGAIDHVE